MKTKVLVVDDSVFMRNILSKMVNSDPVLEVVGVAKNGKEALELIPKLKPDLVTLDIEMPIMDGLETLKHIMDRHPMPVLMVSSLTEKGAAITLKALHMGAMDFFHKPSGSVSVDLIQYQDEILNKIKVCSKTKPAKKPNRIIFLYINPIKETPKIPHIL